MKKLPIVAIVGRTNVGKSTLFNRITGERTAVVGRDAGITRDRKYCDTEWAGCRFSLVDTGGFLPKGEDELFAEVRKQIFVVLEQADAVLFVVDAQTAITDIDASIARMLLKMLPERVILVVNKIDSREAAYEAATFYSLGIGEPRPVSALHGSGIGDILDEAMAIVARCGPKNASRIKAGGEAVNTAIVGRPNAGKSSFVNTLLQEKRCIVDSVPGTTRDAIDTRMRYNNREIVLIDTAGLRRRTRIQAHVEYYSYLRTISAIERSSVCVMMIDSFQGLVNQDLVICNKIWEMKKGMVLCWNKWDAVQKESTTFDALVKMARERYPLLRYVPMISISALNATRVPRVMEKVIEVYGNMRRSVSSGQLDGLVEEWVRTQPHPTVENNKVRIMGARQKKDASHPVFHFYTNYPSLVTTSYTRYLTRRLYDSFDFTGCPVTVAYKKIAPSRSAALHDVRERTYPDQ